MTRRTRKKLQARAAVYEAGIHDERFGSLARLCLLREISRTQHQLDGGKLRTWKDPYADLLA